MKALARIFQVSLMETAGAVRGRRALVVVLLYLLFAVFGMNGVISVLGKIETQIVQVLQLPATDETGVVSATIWKSAVFRKMVRGIVRNESVYADLEGRHPAELVYGWLSFLCVPLLVVLVSANRVADELKSGAVRYQVVRVTRAEWSAGKFFGQAAMIGLALGVGACGAWAVVFFRLSGVGAFELAPALLGWSARAWIYSWAWLGIALGVSHLTRSGSRATALGVLAIGVLGALPSLLGFFETETGWRSCLTMFDVFAPSSVLDLLWRRGLTPLAVAGVRLAILGAFYLSVAEAFFLRRDL